MADPNSTQPSSQMESMPPDLETRFSTECSIDETQSDHSMRDAHESAQGLPPFGLPSTPHEDWQYHDADGSAGDGTQESTDSGPSQVNIFQGNSMFGGDDTGVDVPETPPLTQYGAVHHGSQTDIGLPMVSSANEPKSQQNSFQEDHTGPSQNEDGNVNFGSFHGLPPNPYLDPVLDPTLGTQVSGPQTPQEYDGSVEDNEVSQSPEPAVRRGKQKGPFLGPSRSPSGSPERNSNRSESPGFETDYYRHQKYDLRDREKGPMTTHLDYDQSGNYDPAEEGKKVKRPESDEAKSRKRRSGQSVQEDLDENGQPRPKKPKPLSLSYARHVGASLVYTIRFKSDAGRQLLGRYYGRDNWPDESWNVLSDEYIAQNVVEDEGGDDDADFSGRKRKLLRPRKRHVRYHSPCDNDLHPIADPLGKESDLRHHPAARGCVKCRAEGKRCSLLKSGNTWPCKGCIEAFGDADVVNCDLIVRPERNTACENCLDEDKPCSYEDANTDHSQACQKCQEQNLTCIAGPDMASLPKRITYTPPPGMKYIPYRPFISCTACRQVKKTCSLKSKSDQPPCRACTKAGIPCTFEKLIPTNAGKQKAAVVERNVSPTASSSSATPSGSNFGGAGRVTNVTSGSSHAGGSDTGPVRFSSSSGAYMHNGVLIRDSKAPANPPPRKRDSGIAGMDWRPNNPYGQGSSSSMSKSTSTNITTFNSGANTATEARRKAARRRSANATRMRDRVNHINPVSTMKHSPSKTKDYQPPSSTTPAAYHIPPRPEDRMDMTDTKGRQGYFREVVTALPHPVTFQTRLDPSQPAGCRFCADPRFALRGLGYKKAAVIVWDDGRGYTEIADGHREMGARPPSMCRACVMRRVDIISCVDHEVESLVPALMGREDRDRRRAEVKSRMWEKRPRADDAWCSVCAEPAFWRCCAEQPVDDEDEDGSGLVDWRKDKQGCGLYFCDECKADWEIVEKDFQELLEQRMATEMGVKKCRADAPFLLEDGLLMKSLMVDMAAGN